MLQWGRARASAEIRPGGIKEGRLAVASMGPRSCERGNSFHGGVRLRGDLLQWGRARASAEIPNAVVTALSDGRLQWGRARASAEMPAHQPAQGRCVEALQWGRARASAEITAVNCFRPWVRW